MKYSKASSVSSRMSKRSRPMSTMLVGSMLYPLSVPGDTFQGYAEFALGDNASGTGPTTREGQIIDSAFSTCMVSNRPVPVCNDSRDEIDEGMEDGPLRVALVPRGETGCEVVKCGRLVPLFIGKLACPSPVRETGEDSAGEESESSQKSAMKSVEAAKDKSWETSVSEMSAYDDCVEVVEVVDVVRPRAERRDARGSSCHDD